MVQRRLSHALENPVTAIDIALASYFPAQNSCFREMAYGGAKGKSPPGGAGRAGAAKIAGWRL